MKKSIQNLIFLLTTFPFLSFAATPEPINNESLGPRLANCVAFFSVLSKADSEFSNGLKGFAFASASYAATAFPDQNQVEIEVKKSMEHIAEDFPKLQKDQDYFQSRFEACISTLKIAEIELRPKLNDVTKELVPLFFSSPQ